MHLESWLEGRKPQSPVVPKVDRTNVSWKDIGGCTTPTQIIHLLGPSLIQPTFWAFSAVPLGLLSSGADKEQILLPSGSGLPNTLPPFNPMKWDTKGKTEL